MYLNGLGSLSGTGKIFIAIVMLAVFTGCGTDPNSAYFSTEGSNFNLPCDSPFATPDNCGSGNNANASVRPVCGTDDDTGIIDACGQTLTAVDLHDPVAMSVSGLTPNTRHTIIITDPLTAEITPAGGLIATSDNDGEINKVIIVQNMSLAAELGDYTVSVDEEVPTGTPQTFTYTVENRSRVQCVDSGSNPQASFLSSDTVYAEVTKNDGTLADGSYAVYVMSDLQLALADGIGMGNTTLSVDVVGGTGTVALGTFSEGSYDVIVDVNNNGFFNQGTDLISRHNRLLPCFAVQDANSGTVMVEQIASDKYGNKREIFDPNANIPAIRDIQASVTPSERSALPQPGVVDTYLVTHQAVWAGGEDLTALDATGTNGVKVSPAQNDTNSEAPWIVMPFSLLPALGGTTCYDIVVDTNGDGVFDLGTDYVDNVDHLGNNTCGVRVSTAACTRVSITSHSDGDYLATETAITLEGVISDTPDVAYVTVTAGNQSNTIEITPDGSGNYSVNLPLFAGFNYITVSGVYPDNSSCSETITIERPTNEALFRVQLTWDEGTLAGYDMDLHVVRVRSGGDGYNNGGGGVDDCNFANCKVGLDGSQSPNPIDWGVQDPLVDDDDPKLDVDCISGCDRIENIWMDQISEDGDYQVYVDAYSGDADNVTATMFILGTTVGQVNCGHMESGTVEDSCFVGTIHWSGGSAGLGSFTPSGTKADDF